LPYSRGFKLVTASKELFKEVELGFARSPKRNLGASRP
jgi:hypothetical protein